MAAPAGNSFWKLRSKHGRDRLFSNAEELWESACEYFQWCEDNPLIESVVQKRKISRDEEIVELVQNPKKLAFTLQGLCLYLDCNLVYFNHFEDSLKERTDAESKDFSKIITRIRETIYNQKFTGAASGFFNANIIARDLGLSDRKELDLKGSLNVPQIPDIATRK